MKKVTALLTCILLSTIMYAQDSNTKLLDKLVEKDIISRTEANAILLDENTENKKTNSSEKIRDLFNNPYLQLSGYGILKYEYDNTAKNHHDFKARVVYLTIAGQINNKLRYSVLYDFANPKLHELWGEWTACDYFNLKIGQFKVPLSFENQFAPGNLEYGMFSRPTLYLMGHGKDAIAMAGNGQNNIGRDLGVQASGTLIKLQDRKFLDYAAGLFQGSGINTSDLDNTKDIASSLTIYPIKGLRIGGGTYFGKAAYRDPQTKSYIASHTRNRYVASAEYSIDRFKARTEYMRGKDAGINHDGFYGMAMYDLIPKKINALAKVSYYDQNKDAHAEVMDYTIGFNYNIFALTRIQLNYTYSDYTKNWGSKDNHNVLVQFQLGF